MNPEDDNEKALWRGGPVARVNWVAVYPYLAANEGENERGGRMPGRQAEHGDANGVLVCCTALSDLQHVRCRTRSWWTYRLIHCARGMNQLRGPLLATLFPSPVSSTRRLQVIKASTPTGICDGNPTNLAVLPQLRIGNKLHRALREVRRAQPQGRSVQHRIFVTDCGKSEP